MAGSFYNDRYESWEDYYLKKKEEPNGYFKHLVKRRVSAFDHLPGGYVNSPDSFRTIVNKLAGTW
jgi:hypothetical protein